jgi:hypothetical protein
MTTYAANAFLFLLSFSPVRAFFRLPVRAESIRLSSLAQDELPGVACQAVALREGLEESLDTVFRKAIRTFFLLSFRAERSGVEESFHTSDVRDATRA